MRGLVLGKTGVWQVAAPAGLGACGGGALASGSPFRTTDSAISMGVTGRLGLSCFRAIPPVGATQTMTLRVSWGCAGTVLMNTSSHSDHQKTWPCIRHCEDCDYPRSNALIAMRRP